MNSGFVSSSARYPRDRKELRWFNLLPFARQGACCSLWAPYIRSREWAREYVDSPAELSREKSVPSRRPPSSSPRRPQRLNGRIVPGGVPAAGNRLRRTETNDDRRRPNQISGCALGATSFHYLKEHAPIAIRRSRLATHTWTWGTGFRTGAVRRHLCIRRLGANVRYHCKLGVGAKARVLRGTLPLVSIARQQCDDATDQRNGREGREHVPNAKIADNDAGQDDRADGLIPLAAMHCLDRFLMQRRRVGEDFGTNRAYSENVMVCNIAYPAVARIRTSVAEVAPSQVSVKRGTIASRNAVTYQRLRPTLSISSAQTIDAMTPKADVIHPYPRLVCRGS